MEEPSAFERWEQDRRMEEALRKLRAMAANSEAAMIEAMNSSLTTAETYAPDGCPPPLSWHPYYRSKSYLIDWLNDDEACGLPLDSIRIPVPRSLRAAMINDEAMSPIGPSLNVITIRKRRAQGPAPYVGRPFVYRWNVGEDELGRRIAGESRIVYKDY